MKIFTALEFTGGVPFDILKPVLERATADQLFVLEHYNPYLMEDTDVLWKYHSNREFKKNERQEMESWREMYMVIRIKSIMKKFQASKACVETVCVLSCSM